MTQSVVMDPKTLCLVGPVVCLEPYSEAVKSELQEALDGDHDAWALFSKAGFGQHFETWWADALKSAATKTSIPFAIRRVSDSRVVGTSSFLNIRPNDRAAEIGATFLHADVRGGAVNPATKGLMLGFAFEGGLFGQSAHRVEIVTDARNLRSQAAIAKLGALREGVLRKHKTTWTGHVRDTVVFSITADEWPAVRDALDARLPVR